MTKKTFEMVGGGTFELDSDKHQISSISDWGDGETITLSFSNYKAIIIYATPDDIQLFL